MTLMDWFFALKLIRLFDFYLAVAFLVSTVVRVRQYRTILGVVRSVPARWPRLFALVREHRRLFLTWGTLLPLLMTLVLWATHTILRRLVLTGGEDLTVERLLELWPAVPIVAVVGIAMLAFDLYGTFDVARYDRAELDTYFDQAEYWLRSWTAPVVRIFTLGYVNPRKMVHTEVRTALESASQVINSSLWWLSIQAGLRIAFGVALWVSFALTR